MCVAGQSVKLPPQLQTIIRCFEKGGFVMRDEVLESDCEASVMAVPEG